MMAREAIAAEQVSDQAPGEGAAGEKPAGRSLLESVTLISQDWESILPFFESGGEIDFQALTNHIAETFADYPVIVRQCRAAIDNIARFRRGEAFNLDGIKFVNLKSIVTFIITVGELDCARAFLTVATQRWNWRRSGELMALLAPADLRLPPLEALDHPWIDWQVFDRKSESTIILFCGIAGKFGIDGNVLLPWLFDQDCNIILAHDSWHLLYLQGIASLGPDKQSTVEAIKIHLARLGTKRLATAGNSGGVYAALHYGCLLNADQAVCFAGPATLDAGFDEMEDKPIYERIALEIQEGRLQVPDLLTDIAATNLDVRYFHGAENQFDSLQASRIRHIPSVTIRPLEGWDRHFVIAELARRGQLRDIWRDAVTGTTP